MRGMDEQRPPEPQGPPPAAEGAEPLPAPPDSTGRPWEPAATSPGRVVGADQKRAGTIVVVGALLVIGSQFLPWFTASGSGLTISRSGVELHNWGLLLLGVFALARGASMARPDRFRFSMGTPLIGGAVLIFLLVSRYNDIQAAVTQAPPGVEAAIGLGFWIATIGTALVILGGLLVLRRR